MRNYLSVVTRTALVIISLVCISLWFITESPWKTTFANSQLAVAASDGFSLNGPLSGRLFNIRFESHNANRVWALYGPNTTRGGYGVAVSTDGGASWQPHDTAQRISSYGFNLSRYLEIDPLNNSILYGDGSKSLDGGQSWLAANSLVGGGSFTPNQLVIMPTNTSILYATDNGNVFKSTDGGASWEDLDYPRSLISGIVADPTDEDTLYVYTYIDTGIEKPSVYKTTTAGSSWEEITPAAIDNEYGKQLVVPLDLAVTTSSTNGQPNPLYVAVQGRFYYAKDGDNQIQVPYAGVYRSLDGGASWQLLNNGLPMTPFPPEPTRYTDYVNLAVPLRVDGTINDNQTLFVVAADYIPIKGGTEYAFTHHLYVTRDGGTSWQPLTPNAEDSLYYTEITDLSVRAGSATNNHRVFATLQRRTRAGAVIADIASGIFRSDNAGVNWQRSDNGLSSQRFDWMIVRPDALYAYLNGLGLLKSTDNGATWSVVSTYLLENGVVGTSLLFDPANANTMYLGTGAGGLGILRSSDGGVTWQPKNLGIGAINTKVLAAIPGNPVTFLAMKNQTNVVNILAKSTNNGDSWSDIANAPNLFRITIDPSNSNVLYGQSVPAGGETAGLWKSVNGGATWESLGANADVFALDPNHPQRLYRSSGPETTANAAYEGIDVSTDGGANWTTVEGGTYGVGRRLVGLLPADPAVLFSIRRVGSGCTFYPAYTDYSIDGGQSWQELDAFARGQFVPGLAGSSTVYMLGGGYLVSQAQSNFCGFNVWNLDERAGLWSYTFDELPTMPPSAPVVEFSAATYSVTEDGGNATVTVNLIGETMAGTAVNVGISPGGTATANTDFTPVDVKLTFQPGETSKSVSIPIIKNPEAEPDETVLLELHNPFHATLGAQVDAVLTITDGGAPPSVHFEAASYQVNELATNEQNIAKIAVVLSKAPLVETQVKYSIEDGSAVQGSDYNGSGSTLIFAPGETGKIIEISILANADLELDETLTLRLEEASNAVVNAPAQSVLTIVDADVPYRFEFSSPTYFISEEKDFAVMTVTVDPPPTQNISVMSSLVGGTATRNEDFIFIENVISFGPGQSTNTIGLSIYKDGKSEGSETVLIALTDPKGGKLGEQYSAVLTIQGESGLFLPKIEGENTGPTPVVTPNPSPTGSPPPPPTQEVPTTAQLQVKFKGVPAGADKVTLRITAPDQEEPVSAEGAPTNGQAVVAIDGPTGSGRLLIAEARGPSGVLATVADVIGFDSDTVTLELTFPSAPPAVNCSNATLSITTATPGQLVAINGITWPADAIPSVLLDGKVAPTLRDEAGQVTFMVVPELEAGKAATVQLLLNGSILNCQLPTIQVQALKAAPGEAKRVATEMAGLVGDIAMRLAPSSDASPTEEQAILFALRDLLLERSELLKGEPLEGMMAASKLLDQIKQIRTEVQALAVPEPPLAANLASTAATNGVLLNAQQVVLSNQRLKDAIQDADFGAVATIATALQMNTALIQSKGLENPNPARTLLVSVVTAEILKWINNAKWRVTKVSATPPDFNTVQAGGATLAWNGGTIDVSSIADPLSARAILARMEKTAEPDFFTIPESRQMLESINNLLKLLFSSAPSARIHQSTTDPYLWERPGTPLQGVPLAELAKVEILNDPGIAVVKAHGIESPPGFVQGKLLGCTPGSYTVVVGVDPALSFASNISDTAKSAQFALTVTTGPIATAAVAPRMCPGFAVVEGGNNHSLAIDTAGRLWSWGDNSNGELGINSREASLVPVLVPGLTDVMTITAGLNFSLALDKRGNLWAWGRNGDGQLGLGITDDVLKPSQVQTPDQKPIIAVAAGERHVVAVDSDGQVWAWGHNGYGQLGIGDKPSQSAAVKVNITNVIAVAAGRLHTLALKQDGTVWAWGNNSFGQLGNNDDQNADHNTPVQVYQLSEIRAIAAGGLHSLALKKDDVVWGWGYNKYGQLGGGGLVNRNRPIRVQYRVQAISAGYLHSVFLTAEGNVFAVGRNAVGQLGNESTSDSQGVVLSITNAAAIGAGAYHTLAVDSQGFAWGWGQNSSGQVGDGSLATRIIRYKLPLPPLP